MNTGFTSLQTSFPKGHIKQFGIQKRIHCWIGIQAPIYEFLFSSVSPNGIKNLICFVLEDKLISKIDKSPSGSLALEPSH